MAFEGWQASSDKIGVGRNCGVLDVFVLHNIRNIGKRSEGMFFLSLARE